MNNNLPTQPSAKTLRKLAAYKRAINTLNKLGTDYECQEQGMSIQVKTTIGIAVYYPSADKYNLKGEFYAAKNAKDFVKDISNLKPVIKSKPDPVKEVAESANPYAQVRYDELIAMTPVNKLAAICTSNLNSVDDYEDMRGVYKSYVFSVKRFNEILHSGRFQAGTTEYESIRKHKDEIFEAQKALKDKFPFLGHRRRMLQSFIIDCIKEDMSTEQWDGYVRRAEKRIFTSYSENDYE